eukprot:g12335.t1
MQSFIENTLGYAGHVFIALHVTLDDIQDKDKKSTFGSATKVLKSLTDQEQTKVTLVPILSWGRFTTALNTLLTKAAQLQYKYILYKSFEVRLSQQDVLLMKNQVDTCTLVVGARLKGHDFPSYDFTQETRVLRGTTVPWNTCALWNVQKLAKTGFSMIGDGFLENSEAGVEEVTTISILQAIHKPDEAKAKLIELNSVVWKTKFANNLKRQVAHKRKMDSKNTRAESQMRLLGNIKPGSVVHISSWKSTSPSIPAPICTVTSTWDVPFCSTSHLKVPVKGIDEVEEKNIDTSLPAESSTSFRNLVLEQKEEKQKHGKTVLVTGGAGFIGSHTTAKLLKRGDNVIVVDEINDYYDPRRKKNNLRWLKCISDECSGFLELVKGDICNGTLMEKIFQKFSPTHIIHLAARAGVRASIDDPLVYVHSNVRGTTTLLELARKYQCKHFVYASSSSVYGGSKKEVFCETDVINAPVSPYAATKVACELLASTYSHLYDLPTAGLRFFTVYGPRGRPDMAPYKFLHRIFNGVAIDQYGDGTSERDYTYVGDIVDGVVRACDRPLGCQVYNLGNGRPISLKRFIQISSQCAMKDVKINVMPMQPGDVPRTCANIEKAKKLLGYNPKVKFEEGMKLTAEWYKNANLSK